MIAAELFDQLRDMVRSLDADAKVLDPSHVLLADVIAARDGGPRPEGAYATIDILSQIDTGEVDSICYDTVTVDGAERVVEERTRSVEVQLRIDVYASAPDAYAKIIEAGFRSPRAELDLPGYRTRRVEHIKYGPELIQQKWEGRAALTVELAGLVTGRTLIDVIDSGTVALEAEGTTIAVDIPYERTP